MNETVIRFYVVLNDEQQGPYTLEQLQKLGLDADTLVWKAGMADWTPAGEVEVLQGIVRPPVPEPTDEEVEPEPSVVPPPAPSVAQVEQPIPPIAPQASGYEQSANYEQGPNYQAPPTPPMPQPEAFGQQPPTGGYGQAPQQRPPFISRYKGLFFFLFFLVALCAVLAATKPNEKKHRAAISQLASDIIESQVDDVMGDPYSGFGASILTSGIVDKVTDHMVTVKDYGLFSLGQVEIEGRKKTLSLGILGHVFTFSDEDFEAYMTHQQAKKRKAPRIQEEEEDEDSSAADSDSDGRYSRPVLHDHQVAPDESSTNAPDTIDLF